MCRTPPKTSLRRAVFALLPLLLSACTVDNASLRSLANKAISQSEEPTPAREDSSSSSSSASPSSSTQVAEDPDARHRAEGEKRAKEIAALDDAAIADFAAKELFGLVNEVEERRDDPNDATDWVTGAFTPAYVAEARALKERYAALLQQKYGANTADELYGKVLPALLCVENLRFAGRLDKKGEADCHKGHRGYSGFSADDPLKVGLLLEGLLPALDEESQQAIRLNYVNTLGFKRTLYKYESLDTTSPNVLNRDTYWGVELERVPTSEWTYRTVRYAHDYAKRHKLDPKTVKDLAAWMPKVRRYSCRRIEGVYLIQDHEGGGRYGRPQVGSWDLSGAKEIDCKKAKRLPSTAAAMKVLKKTNRYDYRVERWIGAKASGGWQVQKNDLGVPLRKVQPIDLVWREEI